MACLRMPRMHINSMYADTIYRTTRVARHRLHSLTSSCIPHPSIPRSSIPARYRTPPIMSRSNRTEVKTVQTDTNTNVKTPCFFTYVSGVSLDAQMNPSWMRQRTSTRCPVTLRGRLYLGWTRPPSPAREVLPVPGRCRVLRSCMSRTHSTPQNFSLHHRIVPILRRPTVVVGPALGQLQPCCCRCSTPPQCNGSDCFGFRYSGHRIYRALK